LSPIDPAKQKSHRKGGFFIWWRRRESNPRPQVLYRQHYMLSQVIWSNRSHAGRQAGKRRVTLVLIPQQVTRYSTISRIWLHRWLPSPAH